MNLPSCTPLNCTGCCLNNACQPGNTATNCGIAASTCQVCAGTQSCMNGTCQTVCNATTCPTGCCDGNTCQLGITSSACGLGGNACAMCSAGMNCTNQMCVTPVATGELCTSPIALSVGSTVMGTTENRAKNSNVTAGSCQPRSGADVFYSVTVPAGQVLTVAVTPAANSDILLNLIDPAVGTCSAVNSCLTAADSGANGGTETILWSNMGATAKTVLLMVADYVPQTGTPVAGPFSIQATIGTYSVRTRTGVACTPMSAAAVPLPSLKTDDAITMVPLAIQFPFSFFKTAVPMTHFAVSSNGYIQLFPSMAGSPTSDSSPSGFPSTTAPNAVVAPYWADLDGTPSSSPTANVRYEVSGSAPTRVLTVEWTDFLIYAATPNLANKLTMQAKLLETSNGVEFYYCAVSGTATGAAAAIGLENQNGTEASIKSYNQANSIATGTSVKFIP
jgi:hypothetical protein